MVDPLPITVRAMLIVRLCGIALSTVLLASGAPACAVISVGLLVIG